MDKWEPFLHLTLPVRMAALNLADSKTLRVLGQTSQPRVPAYPMSRGAPGEKGEPWEVPGIHTVL